MQLFRSALVVSLSMFSVSANALSGVYRCPGHKYDVEAKYVEEYINRNVIDTEKADWAHFEENGVQYQNLILFVIDPLTGLLILSQTQFEAPNTNVDQTLNKFLLW